MGRRASVRVVFLPDVGLTRKDATDLCLRDAEKVRP